MDTIFRLVFRQVFLNLCIEFMSWVQRNSGLCDQPPPTVSPGVQRVKTLLTKEASGL
jgi:hypothetical protein